MIFYILLSIVVSGYSQQVPIYQETREKLCSDLGTGWKDIRPDGNTAATQRECVEAIEDIKWKDVSPGYRMTEAEFWPRANYRHQYPFGCIVLAYPNSQPQKNTRLVFNMYEYEYGRNSNCEPNERCICTLTCPVGKYQDQEKQRSCKTCPAGYYQAGTGQRTCTIATAGYYVPEEGNTYQVPCGGGTYNEYTGKTSLDACIRCPVNTYSTTTIAQAQCTKCESGKYHNKQGQTDESSCIQNVCSCTNGVAASGTACTTNDANICSACKKGYRLDELIAGNGCAQCGSGQYQVANNFKGVGFDACNYCAAGLAFATTTTACTTCTNGKYQKTNNQRLIYPLVAVCKTCAAGEYAVSASVDCKACETGKFQELAESIEYNCKFCTAGTKFATKATACVNCINGQYQEQNTLATAVCKTCAAGQYTVSASVDCKACETGKFQELAQSTKYTCNFCAAGMHQKATGQSSCTTCGTGKYQNQTGQSSCAPCGTGKYNGQQGQSSCTPCGTGKYNGQQGQTSEASCESCTSGQYSSVAASSCESCTSGQYSSVAASSCFGLYWLPFYGHCGASGGDWGKITSKAACEAAAAAIVPKRLVWWYTTVKPDNHLHHPTTPFGCYLQGEALWFNDNNASDTPCSSSRQCICTLTCQPGKYFGGQCTESACTGKFSCKTCASGQYQDQSGKSSCKTCASDTYSTVAASSCPYSATTCPVGTYASGTASCDSCGTGKYNAQTSQTSESVACKSCDVGEYQNDEGQASCNSDCVSPMVITLNAICIDNKVNGAPCPPGTYQDQSGQSSCKTCANGTYSTVGAVSCPYSANICPVGTYASGTTTVCDSCGTGKYNAQTNQTSESVCKSCDVGEYQNEEGKTSCNNNCVSPMVLTLNAICIDNNGYKERTSGSCGDSGGGWGKITSAAACEAGAVALGWGDTTASTLSWPTNFPPGCYYRWDGSMHFNTGNSNVACSSDNKCFCTLTCQPGTYQDETGQSSCKTCASGTYSTVGAVSCPYSEICPVGTYASGTTTVCDSCGTGKYNAQTNQMSESVACKSCNVGEYQNEEGKASCNPCATSTYSGVAASNCFGIPTCQPGTYQDQSGQSSCKTCASGQYQSGQSSCNTCASGTYSTVGASSCPYFATTCPAGTYANGVASCDSCGTGKYNDQTSQTSESVCKSCDVGEYQNEEGQASCKDCVSPMVLTLDARCIDNNGYKERTSDSCGDSGGGWGKITSAAACEAGAVALGWGDTTASTSSWPTNFPPGCYYRWDGSMHFNTGNSNVACSSDNKCFCTLTCQPGTYQDETGQSSCKTCVSGKYQDQSGQASCKTCASGQFQDQSVQSSCKTCASGQFQYQSGQSSCKTCASGTYSTVGAVSCPYSATTCPVGTYASGTTSCDSCGTGKYNNQINQTSESVCKSCDVGEYQNEEGKASCNNDCVSPMVITWDASRCIDNRVYKERTSDRCGDSGGGWGKITSAAACGVGAVALGWDDTTAHTGSWSAYPPGCFYSSGDGLFFNNQNLADPIPICSRPYRKCLCTLTCQPGTYQDQSGQSSCKTCASGQYQDQSGQSFCKTCASGKYNDQTGQSTCKSCPSDTYSIVGASGCPFDATSCPVGTYASGSSSCSSCGTGKYNDQQGQTSEASCESCGTGKYNGQQGQTSEASCESCGTGKYNGQQGQTSEASCESCGTGKYNGQQGQSSCTPCATGKYNDQTGQWRCKSCDAGQYQNDKGKASCNNDCVSPMLITLDARCIDNIVYKERTSGQCGDSAGEGKITSSAACGAGAAALGWGMWEATSWPSPAYPPGCFNSSSTLYFNTDNSSAVNCTSNDKLEYWQQKKCLCTQTCQPGTYQDQSGQSSCKTCTSGTYSTAGASSCPYSATTCPVGTYANGTVSCLSCTTCGTGKRPTTDCSSSSNRVCTQNVCSCSNGVAATGTACTSHGTNICSSCSGEYYKTGSTCTGCTTCDTGTGKRQTTTCSSSSNRVCTQNVCSCSNGVAATGMVCTSHGTNICSSCSGEYYKTGSTCTGCTTCGTGKRQTTTCSSSSNRVCTQNVCSCSNGVAATGMVCTSHGTNICSSCSGGHYKTSNTCTGCTTCGTGTRETTACSSSSNRVCTQNVCSCTNGVIATSTACTTHSNNICSSCSGGHYKTGNTCTGCATCGTGKRQTTACSSSSNRVCTQNVCSCSNGVIATGTACTSHDAHICSSCSDGYYKTGDTSGANTTCAIINSETSVSDIRNQPNMDKKQIMKQFKAAARARRQRIIKDNSDKPSVQKRELVKASKMELIKDDLPDVYNTIKKRMKDKIAYVVVEYNSEEVMDCTGLEDGIPNCCSYDFSQDTNTSVIVGLEEIVGAWSVLCDNATIVSKQTRISNTGETTGSATYDMQCWDSDDFGTNVTIATGGEHVCAKHIVLVGSQTNGELDPCDDDFTTNNIAAAVGTGTASGGNVPLECNPGSQASAPTVTCTNGTWSQPTCDATRCAADQHVSNHTCVACAPGTTNVVGNFANDTDTACDGTPCAADQHVSNHTCVDCAPGTTNVVGNFANDTDTACDATRCAVDEYVSNHTCVACAPGTTNVVGNFASGDNTSCTEIDDCATNPCQNNGTCTDGTNNTFTCTCVVGFSGATCNECEKGKGKNTTGHCEDCTYPTYNNVTSHNAECAEQTCPEGKGVTSDKEEWYPDGNNCQDCGAGYNSPNGTGQCTASACTVTQVSHSNTDSITGTTGQSVNVTCDQGYTSSTGSVQCQSNGTFTSMTCEPSACNVTQVSNSDKATKDSITGTTGQSVDVICDQGYTSTSVQPVVNVSYGYQQVVACHGATVSVTWQGMHNIQEVASSSCSSATIGQPVIGFKSSGHTESFTNNELSASPGSTRFFKCTAQCAASSSRIEVSCPPNSPSPVQCQSSGTFTPMTCDPVACTHTQISNSDKTTKDSITGTMGQSVDVTCEQGYTSNNSSVRCQSSGTFTPMTCDPVACTHTQISNSDKTTKDSITGTMGQSVDVTCEQGYTSNNSSVQCQSSGTFTPMRCDATLCAANQYVSNHTCAACLNGTINTAGDDASGDNTSCTTCDQLRTDWGFNKCEKEGETCAAGNCTRIKYLHNANNCTCG